MGSLQNQDSVQTLHSLLEKLQDPIIIGITGDSGSGKTTYSNGIRRLLGRDIVKTIDMDGYHTENRDDRKKTGHLPLDPAINNLDLLYQHLKLLKQWKAVNIPLYNHITGNFDNPMRFTPSPIIIVEGLHALYPQFLPLYDFTIYVDPNRSVKWKWKYERDLGKRGHLEKDLVSEMHKREAAYKRYIDFQKTNANVVVKIKESRMNDYARYEILKPVSEDSYKVEIMIEQSVCPFPLILLNFNLATLFCTDQDPFLLAAVPSLYWGRKVMAIHVDGVLPKETVDALEKHIIEFTGIPIEKVLKNTSHLAPHEQLYATQFAQLLITWRFLEQINYQLLRLQKPGKINC